ncbi:M20/M25/M40 family metallo-hydrolase [Roseibacterium beibuensis]|uniref:ArgE/DapE family deacylase n=1 Tax=[Roseibacterium] beibuensis TaxID=1193142 RepID=A0ABP9L9B2_9RHOB|nr:M20/M25/M40 family metallo-hydrolase [Roseibacterium beibuensis]MCS6623767.1 M20/M25/M40 family metallo-hydrolase [Roseibacterium beibuensis]
MTHGAPRAERLTADLARMVAIPSVNPFAEPPGPGHREEEMAQDLVAHLDALGLETGRRDVAPGRPNVWGRLRGTGQGPTVLLAAHLDTVGTEGYPDAHAPRIAEGRVTGRGACDMKAAIACYLEVVRLLQEGDRHLPGDLLIAGLCDEEDQMIGSRDWGSHGPAADFAIVGEPTGLAICPAHKGQLCTVIRTEGVATHSSRPELGVNAVEHMAQVIVAFADLDAALQSDGPAHPLCGHGRFSMNVIRGGTIASAIPATCALEVDRRFLPGESPEAILADYEARLEALSDRLPDLRATVSAPTLLSGALDTPQTSPLVQALVHATAAVTGSPARVGAFPGATDAPNLGCPAVICGPGHLEQAHSCDEWVAVEQMEKATQIYLASILDLMGQS